MLTEGRSTERVMESTESGKQGGDDGVPSGSEPPPTKTGFLDFLRRVRDSRVTLVAVVSSALFMDELLLSVVVPILPVVFLRDCPAHNDSSAAVDAPGIIADDASDYTECEKSVNTKLGIIMGSQFVVRLVMSFFASFLCDKLGYPKMMMIGCALMLVSAMVYAIADSYWMYFTARMIQGLAAIPNDVGGLGFIGYRFRDDDETRGCMLGLAISGFAVGTMAGPPFGGVIMFYLDERAPFLFLVGLLMLLAVAELLVFRLEKTEHREDPMAMFKLLSDPLILITAGALAIGSIAFGLLEPSLPVWMITEMDAEDWQLGVIFLPSGLTSIFCSATIGYVAYKVGRWLCVAIGLVSMSICVALIPIAKSFEALLLPMTVFGVCFGILDSTACAIFNYLVAERHNGAYGGAATLSIMAFSFGFVVGPTLSAVLVNFVGFDWMLRILAMMALLYSPIICLYLRKSDRAPPRDANDEKMMLILPEHKTTTVPCLQQ